MIIKINYIIVIKIEKIVKIYIEDVKNNHKNIFY